MIGKIALTKYEVTVRYRSKESNRIKRRARRLVEYRIFMGYIKPLPCKRCKKRKTEAHHPDYSKPLEVIWLCRICHCAVHRELKEREGVDNSLALNVITI